MITKRLAVIGVGNMGGAIVRRFIDKKTIKASNLILCEVKLAYLIEYQKIGCLVTDKPEIAVRNADLVLLAVKPQGFPTLLSQLKESIKPNQLILSIAAGVAIDSVKKILGKKQPVVRVMPNLCAAVGESMSVWVKSREVTQKQELLARGILQAIGKEVELSREALIDVATAISGSGPAYVFYLTELLEANAKELGIAREAAAMLARQTVIGSAKVLKNSKVSAKELRLNVTSKGGTTEAAFVAFEDVNLKAVFKNGIQAAWERAKELRKIYSGF